ncbi:hypothetical protein ACJMK2_041578 [Sinanodonta woodiana]|uniref:Eukaryotic translation initiation factor 2D n=1 Tax=Sinanodonta woodiana TaxID=1069815 RepID=A0ABD3W4L4_SINWO
MFKKPFQVKTQTLMKGSDRRRLKADIGKLFPQLTSECLSEMIPNKEEMTVTKIFTHAGDSAFIYSVQKKPLFFEVEKIIYPTVYLLWKYTDLLPLIFTWPPVFSKLVKGADLMLPGVVVRGQLTPNTFSHLQKGDLCAISLLGNKAPVAVGKMLMSGSDMFDSGMKGKGVQCVHILGDELWAFGDNSKPPDLGDDFMPDKAEGMDSTGNEESEVFCDNLSLKAPTETLNQPEDASLPNIRGMNLGENDEATGQKNSNIASIQTEQQIGISGDSEKVQEEEMSLEESGISKIDQMDEILYTCFLCALKNSVKKSDLPLLTSTFFKSFMSPYRPSGKILDIKKSRYKKLSKFLQSMEKKGFIKVKELSKGVDSIVEVDRSHPELKDFKVPDDRKLEETVSSTVEGSKKEFQPPTITEKFGVTAAVLPLVKTFGYSKGSALSSAEVRSCVTDYVKANSLQMENFESQIQLDPVLADVILNKEEGHITTLTWEQLFLRFTSKMQPVHEITFPGQPPVLKKGKVEPIRIDVVQRASNKKITLVENLETYGIDPEEFAHTVQIGVACSTSVSPLPQKNKGFQVMIQGNQINFVADLLTGQYKIARKCITGLEKAPKKR